MSWPGPMHGRVHKSLGSQCSQARIIPSPCHKTVTTSSRVDCSMPSLFLASGRPHLKNSLRDNSKDLGHWTSDSQIPVVYSDRYNFTFWGVEKLHPFDSCKFRTIIQGLAARGCLEIQDCVVPEEAGDDILLDVHTQEYLQKLKKDKCYVVQVM